MFLSKAEQRLVSVASDMLTDDGFEYQQIMIDRLQTLISEWVPEPTHPLQAVDLYNEYKRRWNADRKRAVFVLRHTPEELAAIHAEQKAKEEAEKKAKRAERAAARKAAKEAAQKSAE